MPAHAVQYVPHVVVKFRDVPYDAAALKYDPLRYLDQAAWAQLQEQFEIEIERLFKLPPERILELVREAVASAQTRQRHYKPPNFLTYFAIPSPKGVGVAKAVAKAMSEWPGVQLAYVAAGPADPPGVNPGDNPLYAQQKHHMPAPHGINSEHAWGILGGDGGGNTANLQFVDIEQGWILNHKDLPIDAAGQPAIRLIYGTNGGNVSHGTHTLCAVLGVDNVEDGIGIAPKVKTTMVASILPDFYRERAYEKAVASLSSGDILLLEDQLPLQSGNGNWPVEEEQALFDVIQLATEGGKIVIEPAGNGPIDLDPYSSGWGNSGAIMVAAATVFDRTSGGGKAPRSPEPSSNFGKRIDCYAWGEAVFTRTDATGNPIGFGQTSAASAMIAGVALALQGIKKANTGGSYSPEKMRDILCDWRNGTVSANSSPDAASWNRDRIGVMPDLKNITVNEDLFPDIYIRDNTTDDGQPHTGRVSSSPDIILRDTQFDPRPDQDRAAAQAYYQEGTGRENDSGLSNAVQGKDHYIYVRVKNRGNAGAENVEARVYWSEVATLLDPNHWNRVDPVASDTIPSVVIPQVQKTDPVSGDKITLSSSIHWPGIQGPTTGHYCFVALVGNTADPPPDRADFMTWSNFMKFIRDNNNVTWRNFNVVDDDPTSSSDIPLEFDVAGAWDEARAMRFEVVAQLPDETKITLQAPIEEEEVLKGFAIIDPIERDTVRQIVRGHLHLNKDGRSQGELIHLRKKFRAEKCQLQVNILQEFRHKPREIYIRQLCKEVEVGRITWRLRPKDLGGFGI